MAYYTPRLDLDIDRYLCDQDKLLDGLPTCADCEQPIQDMECYRMDDGKVYCESCMERRRILTEDAIYG